MNTFLSLVAEQYTVIAKNKDAKLDIEAIADMMTKDQYAILSATKDLKFDGQPEEYLPWLGVKGLRKQALLKMNAKEDLGKAKFVHIVTLVKDGLLTTDLKLDEAKAKKLHKKFTSVSDFHSIHSKKRQKEILDEDFERKKTRVRDFGLESWLRVLFDLKSPEEATEHLMAMGYQSVEGIGQSMIFMTPKALKPVATYRLDLPEKARFDRNLTPEEKEILEQYAPDLGEHNSFRMVKALPKVAADAHKMSDDDLAWHLLNSKHALELGDEDYVRKRFGIREISLLQLMNKNISKKQRTGIASWMLDKSGVTFVGGPLLEKYISALAKTGAVDKEIIEQTQKDELQEKIFYGQITDPDELRKIDYKEYDYQLANNQHTPSDVLEKIVEWKKKSDSDDDSLSTEVTWSGTNPRYGGKLGVDSFLGFQDALKHKNYPITKVIPVFEKYLKKYGAKAVKGMISSLWDKEDLPLEVGHKIKDLLFDYEKKEYLPSAPPACFKEKDFLDYWKEIKALTPEIDARGVLHHPHTPTEVLKELLDSDKIEASEKQEIYKILRQRGEISDEQAVKKVKKELKFEGPEELLKHFGISAWSGAKGKQKLTFTPVPKAEMDDLKKEMAATTVHDDFTFEVVAAYRVDKQIHEHYHKKAEELGNIKRGVYHGTSLANAAGILAKGIDTESDSRTGQMFGAGFYLAASASKAAQYASDNFSKSGFGVVFKMDVALGKNAVWKYGRPEKDQLEYADQESQKKVQEYHKSNKLKKRPYEVPVWHTTHDSIHAKKGLALQHDEFVVKSGQQVNITEIILVHKEKKQ